MPQALSVGNASAAVRPDDRMKRLRSMSTSP
jgi:hypothetical protein